MIGQHQEVAQLLIENGALTINLVRDLAAICIQKVSLKLEVVGSLYGFVFCV